MADKLMYIHNDNTQNYPFCRLKFVVETFEVKETIEIHYSPQSYYANEWEEGIIQLWGLM